jgi:hypothetical protein
MNYFVVITQLNFFNTVRVVIRLIRNKSKKLKLKKIKDYGKVYS